MRRVGCRGLGKWGKKTSRSRHGSRASPVKAHLMQIPVRQRLLDPRPAVLKASHVESCYLFPMRRLTCQVLDCDRMCRFFLHGGAAGRPPVFRDRCPPGCTPERKNETEGKWIHERPPVNSNSMTKRRWWFYRNVAKYHGLIGSDRGDHSGWRDILLFFRKFRKGAVCEYRRQFGFFEQWKDSLARPDRPGRMISKMTRNPVRWQRRLQRRRDLASLGAQSLEKTVGDRGSPGGFVCEPQFAEGCQGSQVTSLIPPRACGPRLSPSVSSESNYDDLWE